LIKNDESTNLQIHIHFSSTFIQFWHIFRYFVGEQVLEYWSVGVLKCWRVGVLECWRVDVLLYLSYYCVVALCITTL